MYSAYTKDYLQYGLGKGCSVLKKLCERDAFFNKMYAKGLRFVSKKDTTGKGLDPGAEPLRIL